MSKRKLPADYAVDALAVAAADSHMSYGKLVAATTREERVKIAERYRVNVRRRSENKQKGKG